MRSLILGKLKNDKKMVSMINKTFNRFLRENNDFFDKDIDVIFIYVSDWAGENGVEVIRNKNFWMVLLNEKSPRSTENTLYDEFREIKTLFSQRKQGSKLEN